MLLLCGSCAQVTSLNLKKHQFGKIPTKIIWVQLAGFSAEHMALLKFSYPSREKKTAFEQSLCVGTTWDYNLYDLRPSAYENFLSQLTGKKNIKNSCEDFEQRPIWKYISDKNYKIGIFEGESNKEQSLLKSQDCKNVSSNYLNDVIFWKMGVPPKDAKLFHIGEKNSFRQGDVYFDKSCSTGKCFTSLSRNIESNFSLFQKNTKNYLYVIRNFQYLNLLKQKRIKEAKSELAEINEVIDYFQSLAKDSSDILVLVTSAAGVELNFPRSGKEWKAYENEGRNIKISKRKLVSPLYATGARAENFCGVYEQSDLLKRIFSGAKQQGLEFSIINPFEN
ncbi:MAG: hypothetical protein QF441_00175 [Bacteriovoracaceae bacterium]|jgi:hypothetical protein|nr:hypothetical protein [Bacteriovoracaceae bacterium]